MDQSRVTESQLKRVLVSGPKTGITIGKAHVYQQGNCFSPKVLKDGPWLWPVSPVPVGMGIVGSFQSFSPTGKSPLWAIQFNIQVLQQTPLLLIPCDYNLPV